MTTYQLQGLRILNTRPRGQAEELNQRILASHGQVLHFPVLDIQPPNQPWVDSLPDLNTINQALFISTNAVQYCFDSLEQHKIVWPQSIFVTAIGKTTAQALRQHHIIVGATPLISDSEHVLKLPSLQQIHSQIILVIKGEDGRSLIIDTLKNRGAQVIALNVYQRGMPIADKKQLDTWWRDDPRNIILLTSQQAIHNLFQMIDPGDVTQLQRTPCLVISERLAMAARELGMKTVIVCQVDNILEALHQYKQGLTHG
jgi:uroporphyrinogen-III synthase